MPAAPQPSSAWEESADPVAHLLAVDDLEPGGEEIPPESGWDWSDPDCSRPPELAGLTYEELDALPATTPARYHEPAWPIDPPSPGATGQLTRSPAPATQPGDVDRWPQDSSTAPVTRPDEMNRGPRDGSTAPVARPDEMNRGPRDGSPALVMQPGDVDRGSQDSSAAPHRWPGEMSCWLRDGTGGGAGFADGGALDTAPAGLALAGFTTDAQAQLGTLTDDELTGVIRAWRRLSSWASAGELQAIAALARRRPADGTPPAAPGEAFPRHVSEFVGEEVAAALTLTPISGGRVTDLAIDLAGRLAPVREVLAAGWLDLSRARLFAQATEGLTDAHAAAVVAAVLPQAPELTSGRLRRALDRAVLAADPGAAQKQRDAALADARVDCWPDPCGTANLAGRNLPAASVLAADKRLDAIARAWQAAGATGGIDQLRARAYLAQLLDQDITQPPADLLPPSVEPYAPDQPHPADAQGQVPEGLRPASSTALPPLAGSVNLTLPLATLLGLADRPGEAAGYGPLDAGTARALACAAAGHRATRWHLTITGPTGRTLGYGSTPASYARTNTDGRWQISVTAEPIAAGSCDHRSAEPQYRPSAALQRIIRARTTTCSYYGCARPASRCDLDHTLSYDDGGPTCPCNLAPLCRRHHRLKQTQHWTLEQPTPGVMAWLTPAGRRYITLPSQHPT